MSNRTHIRKGLQLVLLLLLTPAMAFGSGSASEHAVKAAVAHKIAKFVSWPDHAFDDPHAPIRFCVAGNAPIRRALEELKGRTIHGRQLTVESISRPTAALGNCDVLYVSRDSAHDPSEWIAVVARHPVLTFGETAENGGDASIVTLAVRNNKVRFDINVEASDRAGLNIGAQLLQLAAMSNRRGP